MVEINNQRKAFLDMLAWSEGTDNGRQKTRNHGYDVIVGGELFTDYSDHPRQTCHAKPVNSNQQAPDATSFFPVGGMPHRAAWPERLSPKSQTLWHCSRLRSAGALPMIDRGDIRQAIDRCSNIWASICRALVTVSEHKADSLIAKFKEAAEQSERLMYEQSHRDYLRSAIRIIVCPSWAVNHYRDNAYTYKAQRDKTPENWKLANAAITDMQMSCDVAGCSMQNTRRS